MEVSFYLQNKNKSAFVYTHFIYEHVAQYLSFKTQCHDTEVFHGALKLRHQETMEVWVEKITIYTKFHYTSLTVDETKKKKVESTDNR